jgi:subtilisin family serine protease
MGAGRFLLLVPLLLLPAAAVEAVPAQVLRDLAHPRRPHEFLVRLKPRADSAFAGGRRLRTLRARKADRVHHVRFAAGTDDALALARLRADPAVESADPDYLRRVSALPNDPSFSQQWGLHATGGGGITADADLDAPEAWDVRTDASSVVVAMIDSGADFAHPDLAPNAWSNSLEIPGNGLDDDGNGRIDDVRGFDFVNDDGDPEDEHGHGTHVAGIIGAQGDNGIGVSGVCWSVKLMALRFADEDGVGADSRAIEAFEYCEDLKTRAVDPIPRLVINCSWGSGASSSALFAAMKLCSDAGILLPCAAGNVALDNGVVGSFPANFALAGVISVGAATFVEAPAAFSCYGSTTVHLFAPGDHILSTWLANGYQYLNGTSMAAPFVSGAAALVWAEHESESAAQIRDRLLYSVDRPAPYATACITKGRLNLHRALTAAADSSAPSAVVDLQVSDPSFSAASFAWTAPGDDGAVGTAFLYDVRLSTDPITAGTFEAAQRRPGVPVPGIAGTPHVVRLYALPESNATYYVALRTIDERGNVSPISNVVQVTTASASETRFEDAFPASPVEPAKWTLNAPWALEADGVRPYVLTESPGGDYAPNLDATATSAIFSLVGVRDAVVAFTHRFRTKLGQDAARVEGSGDGGVSWRLLRAFGGEADPLGIPNDYGGSGRIRLDAFDGLPQVRLRFRFRSNGSGAADGWRIDDVAVRADLLPPAAPAATAQSVSVTRDSPKAITLSGSDVNGDPLTFQVSTSPSNGALSGVAPALTYTPNAGYVGADSFTFTVSDGVFTSAPATVSVAVSEPSSDDDGGCGLLGAEVFLLLALLARRRR